MHLVLLLFCIVGYSSSSPQSCCQNATFLVGRHCPDGSNITHLNCDAKYILNNKNEDFEISIDNADNLVVTDYLTIPPEQYCTARDNDAVNGTNIFIVCFQPEDGIELTRYILHPTLLFISTIFLVLNIFIYLITPNILDLQGICILHAISGLAISFLSLGISNLEAPSESWCIFTAYVIYFCTLYAFFWLSTLSFHIWKSVVKPRYFEKRFLEKYWAIIYHIYGCGVPVILLIFLIMAHHSTFFHIPENSRPGLGETKCWFKSQKGEFIYFYGPISTVLFLNLLFYAWTIYVLWNKLSQVNETAVKIMKCRLFLCIRLFFVMGITWFFEIISAALQHYNNWKVFCFVLDIISTLQGVVIFLILVVFRKKVVKNLANKTICGKRLPGRWRDVQDDEAEEVEEEYDLSEYTTTVKT